MNDIIRIFSKFVVSPSVLYVGTKGSRDCCVLKKWTLFENVDITKNKWTHIMKLYKAIFHLHIHQHVRP
jgi:hypothetical protein